MRPAPRAFSVLVVFVLMMLAMAGSASAKVTTVHPARVTPTVATFDVSSLRSADVRSATVMFGGRRASISAAALKRAVRRGRLQVRLPRRWRAAVASRRSTVSRRSAIFRLVVKTRARRSSKPTRPKAPAAPSAPTSVKRPSTPTSPPPSGNAPPAGESSPAHAPDAPPAPAVTPEATITGRTFYVSPRGSDSNSGTAPTSAWRTVARANRAALNPGDGILFEGGAAFSDDTLMPEASGSSGAPIVYGSYGSGRATLRGAWFMGKKWLAFTNLAFTDGSQGVVGSANGSGSTDILVQNSTFRNVGIAINAANPGDRRWTLSQNTVDGTRDSGIILQGDGHLAQANTILNTGTDSSIPYGKHGIYLKASNSRVVGNTIRSFQAEGVSTRYRNAIVDDNVISHGEVGIAWYQTDSQAGTSHWRGNRISDTTGSCLYVSSDDAAGPTRESFVVSGNVLTPGGGRYTNFHPSSGSYSVLSNTMQ